MIREKKTQHVGILLIIVSEGQIILLLWASRLILTYPLRSSRTVEVDFRWTLTASGGSSWPLPKIERLLPSLNGNLTSGGLVKGGREEKCCLGRSRPWLKEHMERHTTNYCTVSIKNQPNSMLAELFWGRSLYL